MFPTPDHGTIAAIMVLSLVGLVMSRKPRVQPVVHKVPPRRGRQLPNIDSGKETGVRVLRLVYLLAQIGIMRALRVDADRVGPVVEVPLIIRPWYRADTSDRPSSNDCPGPGRNPPRLAVRCPKEMRV